MRTDKEIDYLRQVMDDYIKLYYTEEAYEAIKSMSLRFCHVGDVGTPKANMIFFPYSDDSLVESDDHFYVEFGDTKLNFWGKLKKPSNDWELFSPDFPLWWVHKSGALLAAWRFTEICIDLLTLREERELQVRDKHGRIPVGELSRYQNGTNMFPIFNDSMAAIISACVGIRREGKPYVRPVLEYVKSPHLILSHDLDVIKGGNFWNSLSRVSRIFGPRVKLQKRLNAIRGLFVNFFFPKKYYWQNIFGMLTLEKLLGFHSRLYILNGNGGRFGFRNKEKDLVELIQSLPLESELGIHYNFDTFEDPKLLNLQISEYSHITRSKPVAGRAHYLRFKYPASFTNYEKAGILIDESIGFAEEVGYRSGISAPYRLYDTENQQIMSLVEIPLVFMDQALIEKNPDNYQYIFENHAKHLKIVGGSLSLLFHPGVFHNPEFPNFFGTYRKLLETCRSLGFQSSPLASLTNFFLGK